MKKRILTLLLCAALVTALTGTALADVIYEPADEFYFSHAEECGHVNRAFYADAPSGSLKYFGKPGGRATGSFENGTEVYVSATYTAKDGTEWGFAEVFEDGEGGWARMDELLLKYDSRSFHEEFSSQFRDGEDLDIRDTGAVFWTYPESGEIAVVFAPGEGPNPDEPLPVSQVWTDEEGRDWGLVGYYYGIRDRWVCLSDPADEEIAPVSRQTLPDWGSASQDDPAGPSPSPDVIVDPEPPASHALTYVLVAAGIVAVAAIVALQVISQRRKKAK